MTQISKFLWFLLLAMLFACAPQQQKNTAEQVMKGARQNATTPNPYHPKAKAPSTPNAPEPTEDVIIGMILPLTGAQSEIGKHMQDAALMGLYDKMNSLSPLQLIRNPELIIKDSGSNPEQTTKVTEELINAGASIILGPLLSANVKAASALATLNNVPLISFSNNPKVAQKNVYVFGFRSEEQVERIASYALAQKINHYAAIAPQNEYSRKVVREFSDVVKADGYSLQPVNFFTEGQMPPAPILNRIVNKTKEWGEARKGIFLPVTGQSLYAISTRIMNDKKANPAFTKLLGTGLWDDDSVMKIPAMQGAWFATSPPRNSQNFNTKFMTSYAYRPVRMASLAYDAVALAATLSLNPEKPAFDYNTLTTNKGFSGPANGVFRLRPNGLTERSLSVVEVGKNGFRVLDAASGSF